MDHSGLLAALIIMLFVFSVGAVPQLGGGLCAHLIQSAGFPCTEHRTKTEDGYLLGLQRVSSRSTIVRGEMGLPVLLIHGLFMAGDAWFMNSASQSLGFILADQGFDVWVGNVRGTRWSHGHVSLSVKNKTADEFIHFTMYPPHGLALHAMAKPLFSCLHNGSAIYDIGNKRLSRRKSIVDPGGFLWR